MFGPCCRSIHPSFLAVGHFADPDGAIHHAPAVKLNRTDGSDAENRSSASCRGILVFIMAPFAAGSASSYWTISNTLTILRREMALFAHPQMKEMWPRRAEEKGTQAGLTRRKA